MSSELYVYVFGFTLVLTNLGLNIFNMVTNKQVKNTLQTRFRNMKILPKNIEKKLINNFTQVELQELNPSREDSPISTDDSEIEVVVDEKVNKTVDGETEVNKPSTNGYFVSWFSGN